MNPLSQILDSKIVAIIRGAKPADVLKITRALLEGGIKVLEVTLNSEKALAVIEELADQIGDRVLIGAGTVLSAEAAKEAIAAGAKFIISPNVDIETIKMTKHLDVVSIPGAYTPTEIITAFNNGGDIIKVFPASGNVGYIKDIRGPLPHIPLMATGGVGINNILEFKKAGAAAFGIGSSLVNTKEEVTEAYLQQLTINANKLVQALNY